MATRRFAVGSTIESAARIVTAAALGLGLVTATASADDASDLVKRGEELATAGDCTSCHTATGGKPFAGGLEMKTPFGTLSTPNLTPDKATGLGNWTEEQFYTAMHQGIGNQGEYLYPVFPYPSFTKVRKDDVKAIWAYLQSLEPVHAPRKPSDMQFPFDIRAGLVVWRQLYFNEGTYRPDPKWTEEEARGGYLVQGLGHCGACHTPRTELGGTETGDSLGGGHVDTWFAPDISDSLTSGIGDWTKQEIVDYLRKGSAKGKGHVFGPMAEVVHNSLSKLPDEDIEAIAAYLKVTPARQYPTDEDPDLRKRAGGLVYINNCSMCHQPNGKGIPGNFPNLAGNGAITAESPDNVISAVLGGLPGGGTYGQMPPFSPKLTNQEIADVVNYVRNSWGNYAPATATPDKVAAIRASLNAPSAEDGSRPTSAFECPDTSNLQIKPATMNLIRYATPGEFGNRIGVVIAELKRNNPGMDDTQIVDNVSAAYCPILKAESGLADSERHDRMASFIAKLQSQLAKEQLPPGSRVLVQVPFSPDVLSQVEAAAKAANEERATWIEKAAEERLKGSN